MIIIENCKDSNYELLVQLYHSINNLFLYITLSPQLEHWHHFQMSLMSIKKKKSTKKKETNNKGIRYYGCVSMVRWWGQAKLAPAKLVKVNIGRRSDFAKMTVCYTSCRHSGISVPRLQNGITVPSFPVDSHSFFDKRTAAK